MQLLPGISARGIKGCLESGPCTPTAAPCDAPGHGLHVPGAAPSLQSSSIPQVTCSLLGAAGKLESFSVVFIMFSSKFSAMGGFLAWVWGSACGGCMRLLASLHVQEVSATRCNKPYAVSQTILGCFGA